MPQSSSGLSASNTPTARYTARLTARCIGRSNQGAAIRAFQLGRPN